MTCLPRFALVTLTIFRYSYQSTLWSFACSMWIISALVRINLRGVGWMDPTTPPHAIYAHLRSEIQIYQFWCKPKAWGLKMYISLYIYSGAIWCGFVAASYRIMTSLPMRPQLHGRVTRLVYGHILRLCKVVVEILFLISVCMLLLQERRQSQRLTQEYRDWFIKRRKWATYKSNRERGQCSDRTCGIIVRISLHEISGKRSCNTAKRSWLYKQKTGET